MQAFLKATIIKDLFFLQVLGEKRLRPELMIYIVFNHGEKSANHDRLCNLSRMGNIVGQIAIDPDFGYSLPIDEDHILSDLE